MDNFPVIEHLCHAPTQVVLLVLILGISSFVSGMVGFGFSLVGVGVLWILPPREGIPLLMLLSACSQMFSIAQLRSSMPPLGEWWRQGLTPSVIGGWAGIPVGLWVLSHLNAKLLCSLIGIILVAYSLWMVLKPVGIRPMRKTLPRSFGAGLLGGIVGGLSAASGIVMVIWSNLLGLNKVEQRAIVQPFILAMQLLSLLLFAIRGGFFSGCMMILWVSSLIVVLITTKLGVLAFRRLSDRGFQWFVFILLAVSGMSLIAKGASALGGLFDKLDNYILAL